MKTRVRGTVVAVVTWGVLIGGGIAQETDVRWFRVVGPGPTSVTDFGVDGFLTWTSGSESGTCSVEVATAEGGMVSWDRHTAMPVTSTVSRVRIWDPNTPTHMAFIPAGTFRMGDSMGNGGPNEMPVHTVWVSPFYMDRYEVSIGLWDAVHTWSTTNGYAISDAELDDAPDYPATMPSWYDAVKWCNARSERQGLTPCYYTDVHHDSVYRAGQVDLSNAWVDWTANGYRLPTEAEWEKAARGGLDGNRFPWGDIITHSQALYVSSASYEYDMSPTRGIHPIYRLGTSPIDAFPPNGYGLYAMAGNVAEWCGDRFGTYSEGAITTDPRGPETGLYRVFRGSSSSGYAIQVRCANRESYAPDGRSTKRGFRCVRGR